MENFHSPGTKVPGNETFILGERKFPATFVPEPFRPRELSFMENESSWGGNVRSHYPIGLVAALLRVLNYCMFGCVFTLMMLTPL